MRCVFGGDLTGVGRGVCSGAKAHALRHSAWYGEGFVTEQAEDSHRYPVVHLCVQWGPMASNVQLGEEILEISLDLPAVIGSDEANV